MTTETDAFILRDGSMVTANKMSKYTTKQDKEGKSKQLPEDRFDDDYGQNNLVRPLYGKEKLAQLMELDTWHYRATKAKSRDTVQRGWSIELKDGVEEASDEEKAKLIEFFGNVDPDRGQSFEEIAEKCQDDYETTGEMYIEVIRRGNRIDEEPVKLRHLPAHTMRRKQGEPDVYCQKRQQRKNWFRRINSDFDIHVDDGTKKDLGSLSPETRGNELIHIKNPTPRSDIYGLPDNIAALMAILGNREAQSYNIDFFENNAVPQFAVTVTGAELGDEIKKKIKHYFQNEAQQNPHSTLVITAETEDPERDIEIEFEPLQVEMKEGSFEIYRADNRDEVLSCHGVPPSRAMVVVEGKLGGSSDEETNKNYWESVVHPRQEVWENRLTTLLIEQCFEVEDYKFQLNSKVLRNEEFEHERRMEQLTNGVITPNEARKEIGRETKDDEALDQHYVQGTPITGDLASAVTPAVSRSMKSIDEFNEKISQLRNGIFESMLNEYDEQGGEDDVS